MNSVKCPHCGLVNFPDREACKRCGASLSGAESVPQPESRDSGKRGCAWFIKRALVVFATALALLLIFYGSLLKSSERLSYEQQQVVASSIRVLEQGGFSREAFVLKNLVAWRSTDNWLNEAIGHREAYAAANFPFQIVTLYPEFFTKSADDTERAAILLHEAYHLLGSDESEALEGTWRNKKRLGWVKEKYEQTKVWQNTRELTQTHVPYLFRCGLKNNLDCTEF
ncbi:MAG TPA: zinc finger Ran-binding domain-containing protein [Pyrinomonadaceae bacterium]|nr:zinc finger Ran-binding domain-containing protein [Pyrinomonadaceae bacterium]